MNQYYKRIKNPSVLTLLYILYAISLIVYTALYLLSEPLKSDTLNLIANLILALIFLYYSRKTFVFPRLFWLLTAGLWVDLIVDALRFWITWHSHFTGVKSFPFFLFSVIEVASNLPLLLLLLSAFEIIYLVRERVNREVFFINLTGITIFMVVMVLGGVFHSMISLANHPDFYLPSIMRIAISYLILTLVSSLVASIPKKEVPPSFLFLLFSFSFITIVDLFAVVQFFIRFPMFMHQIWGVLDSAAPLLLVLALAKQITVPTQWLREREQKEKETYVLDYTKNIIHYALFFITLLCFFTDFVSISTFSYMNLTLLTYFYALNFYLVNLQSKSDEKRHREQTAFLEEEVKAQNIAILKQNIRLQEIVNKDILTNAYTRRYFLEYLSTIKTDTTLFAIDILQLNNVNQLFGEKVGDGLLIHLYKQLQSFFPKQLIFRVDSDEYAILFENSDTQMEELKNEIIQATSKEYESEFYSIPLEIAVGISSYSLDSEESPENLLVQADFALAEAKKSHLIPRIMVFDQTLADKKYRYGLIQSLLDTIDYDEEFQLYLQPQYTSDGSKLIGAEALLRWFSPKLGFVSPGEFIPIAEESSTIIRIVDWTLKKACQYIYDLNRNYGLDLKIGINISPKFIERPDFYSIIQNCSKEEGFKIHWLDLEITETSVMHLDISVINLFKQLALLGTSTSIDDFGTGYSSLSYIKNLKISTLKIAKELVDNLVENSNDELIINAIIKMAQGLHIKTIAEGVESESQANALKNLGCDYIQGYYFGKPVPIQDFKNFHLR